jgi:hypothetical protein
VEDRSWYIVMDMDTKLETVVWLAVMSVVVYAYGQWPALMFEIAHLCLMARSWDRAVDFLELVFEPVMYVFCFFCMIVFVCFVLAALVVLLAPLWVVALACSCALYPSCAGCDSFWHVLPVFIFLFNVIMVLDSCKYVYRQFRLFPYEQLR